MIKEKELYTINKFSNIWLRIEVPKSITFIKRIKFIIEFIIKGKIEILMEE